MCRAQCVLALVALYVGVARSWDFAVSSGDQLTFHTSNGTETGRVRIQSRNLTGLAYDVVHNRMLYIDKYNNNDAICGCNLSSKENECFIQRSGRNILSIAYDPVTEKLFFTDANEKSINWISLKHGYENNIYGNLLIKMDDRTPDDIAVDSCGGYIYWSNIVDADSVADVERARFSGSGREELEDIYFESFDVSSLTIDPLTQKIYYIDYYRGTQFMNIANMNGSNTTVKFFRDWSEAKEVTVSKEYAYFMTGKSGENYKSVWRLSKKGEGNVDPEEISKFNTNGSLGLATNYKIDDQINVVQNCDSLSNLLTTIPEVSDITDERCDVCVNYCLQGNCSVNDVRLPECSCNTGYTGERCEVSSCRGYCLNDGECSLNEYSVPVCQCHGDYSGDRCQVAGCLNYCFKGNCSLSDKGHPTCSCRFGYSGERCEVSACHGYCLNDGECSLNDYSVPVCQCKGDYSGDRCQVYDCLNYCFRGNCSLNDEGHPTCSCNVGYAGERCEVSACHGYCLNDGECSLNEEDEPVCQCPGNHEGARCEADVTDTTPTYDLAKRNLTVADLWSIWGKRSSRTFVTFEIQP